jgi:hypothetical protein
LSPQFFYYSPGTAENNHSSNHLKMNPLFSCPPPTALVTIPTQACPEVWDQIVRLGFQRKQTTPSFTATTIKTQATWTPLLTAVDSTKIVLTPQIAGIVIPAGEVLKEGGNDNSTINGIPRIAGLGFVPVTAQPQSLSAAVRTALQGLGAESSLSPGYTNIWVYFFNRFGQIIANADGSGFDAYNIMAGDAGTEGFGKLNTINFGFDLAGGWSANATVYNPTAPFNPLNL